MFTSVEMEIPVFGISEVGHVIISPLIVKKISLHLIVLLVAGFSKNGNVLKGISWSKK